MLRRVGFVCVLFGLAVGGILAVTDRSRDERPEFGIDAGDPRRLPRYVAVSDGRRGIAGYAEAALMDGNWATTPEQMARLAQAEGVIVPVYDRSARVVGYFASQGRGSPGDGRPTFDSPLREVPPSPPSGFISNATKDDLVARGYLYLPGTPPTPE
jgi:hypothetical protein